MRNNKKLYVELVLLAITFMYSFGLATLLVEPSLKVYSYMFYHRSYIQSIDTPSYGKLTKLYLDEFNAMADGGIVVYTSNTRPITIQEQPILLQLMYPNAIGLAVPTPTKCNIYIKPGLDASSYRETLIHEYLHCFDYQHTSDRKDLMYYAEVPVDKEDNIKYYAIDLKRKYYVYRFYRF